MRIIRGYPHPNPPPTRIHISFFYIRQYSYPYPYLKVRCGYKYVKDNIWSVTDLIYEGWVLDIDIRMEETILQGNEARGSDILSWWKSNSEKYPILERVAQDILSISTSIVVFESAFSTGGCVIQYYRSRMTMYTVKALICTK